MKISYWNSSFDTHHENYVKTQINNKTLPQIVQSLLNHFVCHRHYHTEVLNNSVSFVQMLYINMFLCTSHNERTVAPRKFISESIQPHYHHITFSKISNNETFWEFNRLWHDPQVQNHTYANLWAHYHGWFGSLYRPTVHYFQALFRIFWPWSYTLVVFIYDKICTKALCLSL